MRENMFSDGRPPASSSAKHYELTLDWECMGTASAAKLSRRVTPICFTSSTVNAFLCFLTPSSKLILFVGGRPCLVWPHFCDTHWSYHRLIPILFTLCNQFDLSLASILMITLMNSGCCQRCWPIAHKSSWRSWLLLISSGCCQGCLTICTQFNLSFTLILAFTFDELRLLSTMLTISTQFKETITIASDKLWLLPSIGTLKDGYIRKVPLPRVIPHVQSASHMTIAPTAKSTVPDYRKNRGLRNTGD